MGTGVQGRDDDVSSFDLVSTRVTAAGVTVKGMGGASRAVTIRKSEQFIGLFKAAYLKKGTVTEAKEESRWVTLGGACI